MTNPVLIKISGNDKDKFLQGQLTIDTAEISPISATLAAHCDDKGRVVSLFYIFIQDSSYILIIDDSLSEICISHFKKYALFSKVDIEEITNTSTVTLPANIHLIQQDFTQWRWQQIKHNIPTLYKETSGIFLPHDINLPKLNAVNFEKGCYLGQEIIARMQHLGKPKRHMRSIILEQANCPQPGDKLSQGQIVDAINIDNQIYATVVCKK